MQDVPAVVINDLGAAAADLEDVVTVRGSIEEALLSGKRTAIYEKKVNTFGTEYYGTIVYNEKAYKSLWKDLD